MLEIMFKYAAVVARHKNAPFAEEREIFLCLPGECDIVWCQMNGSHLPRDVPLPVLT
jgi:hypothetical protein